MPYRLPSCFDFKFRGNRILESSGVDYYVFPANMFKRGGACKWLDVPHQFTGIALLAVLPHAQHAVDGRDTAATANAATDHTRPLHIPRQGAAAIGAAAGDRDGATRSRAGRKPVRQRGTRLNKFRRLLLFAKTLKTWRFRSLTFETCFFVTRGMTGRVPPKNYMIFLKRAVSACGSARRTLASGYQ